MATQNDITANSGTERIEQAERSLVSAISLLSTIARGLTDDEAELRMSLDVARAEVDRGHDAVDEALLALRKQKAAREPVEPAGEDQDLECLLRDAHALSAILSDCVAEDSGLSRRVLHSFCCQLERKVAAAQDAFHGRPVSYHGVGT